MYKFIALALLFFIILAAACCGEKEHETKGTSEYIEEVDQWHQKRIERLKDENGWFNSIVFPENAPSTIGTITLNDSVVFLNVIDGVDVTNEEGSVKQIALKEDLTGEPTILDVGSLRWYIIKRDERYGIRLRDTQHTLRKEFDGIERYAVNDDWEIEGTFEVYDPPKTISLPTQLGTIAEEKSTGAVVFEKNGKTYSIDAIDTGTRLWLIFADETNGEETYGAGRYLYIDKPDSTGKLIVDFNYAYNPPCVFTKYATCAFPPKQNHLRLKITAGEKMWNELH
jgi:uncharacterized protein (DUF1684 family)